MDFGNFREMSVKIGKDRKLLKSFGCLPENAGSIPSAIVIMTTADGMHPVFSGRHPKLFKNFLSLPIFTDITRGLSMTIRPCYVN